MAGNSWFSKALKLLNPGSRSEPAVQPRAPAPGHPAAEDMPAPTHLVPSAGRPSELPP